MEIPSLKNITHRIDNMTSVENRNLAIGALILLVKGLILTTLALHGDMSRYWLFLSIPELMLAIPALISVKYKSEQKAEILPPSPMIFELQPPKTPTKEQIYCGGFAIGTPLTESDFKNLLS